MPPIPVASLTIGLLIAANVFMTFAWLGHLRFKEATLITVILVCWGTGLFEHMLQLPANRIGFGTFTAAQLKTMQKIITLATFAAFSTVYLKEPLGWNHVIGFAFIPLGAWFIFHKWR